MNTTEITEATATTIREAHAEAQRLAADCRANMAAAIAAADTAGLHLCGAAAAHRGRFAQWLAENLADLPPEIAKRYMSIHETRRKRGIEAIDHRQLLLIGVLDEVAVDPVERGEKPLAESSFVRHAGQIRGWFAKVEETRPPEQWDHTELAVAAETLRPVVEIYERITRLAGQ